MEHQQRKPTFKGPSEWFTGDVWIDPLAQAQGPSPVALGWVHFTPGAHTAWHSHSSGQTLCVTEGEGFVQARGEQVVPIRAGDVIVAPPREWHWHGAAPDHFMAHLAFSEGEAEWGDHLTEAEYPPHAPE